MHRVHRALIRHDKFDPFAFDNLDRAGRHGIGNGDRPLIRTVTTGH
jgi:hypothetical protein